MPKNSLIARVTVLTPKQAEFIQPINHLISNYFNQNINALIEDSETKVYPSTDQLWFPTPENCAEPEKLTGIQRRIYHEFVKMKKEETLDPLKNADDRQIFLNQFPWKNSIFNPQ